MTQAALEGRQGLGGPLDRALVGATALGARLAVAWWAGSRFPPVADGVYYEQIARRIAAGDGYTWSWPDGAVTYAGHYPVGYPGALGALYAVFGAGPPVAMALSVVLGVLSSMALHDAWLHGGLGAQAPRRSALFAGLAVALHPALVFHVPVLMTEGVTASLVALGAWTALRSRKAARPLAWLVGLGVVVGLATLVRPQTIVVGPLLAWAARHPQPGGVPGWRLRTVGSAALVLATSLAVVAPWTARNHARMGHAALVSYNGGWNLLIGLDEEAQGGWAPVRVPPACAELQGEAEKNDCFGREALLRIRERPLRWAALAPRKLLVTFEYSGAAAWYLHASNAEAFPGWAKVALGALETAWSRLLLALALAAVASQHARRAPRLVALAAIPCCFVPLGVVAWLGFGLAASALLLSEARAPTGGAPLLVSAGLVVLATAAAHAVFFGSGRYSLPCLPLVAAVGAGWLGGCREPRG